MGQKVLFAVSNLYGGRNDTDPPLLLRDDQATEFLNMDWKDASFGRKRGGAAAIGMTQPSFTPTIDMLERNGLTERRSNETDRRSILIYLLMDGKRLQSAIEAALANAEVRYGGG